MNKFFKFAAAATLTISMAACSNGSESKDDAASADKLSGTYSIHVEGDDWGCGVDKAIVELNKEIESVDKDSFKVTEFKQNTDWSKEDTPVIEDTYDREVTDAYLSDENGEKVDGPSKYVTLDMYISPNDGSPFLYSPLTGFNTWSDPYELTITLNEGKTLKADGAEITELTVEGKPTGKTTEADVFEASEYKSSDGWTLPYATWTPEEKSDTLFVWLHGMGEGGANVDGVKDATDVQVPILANEVTQYISDDFQKTLGGANVLVPQAPSYWMDRKGDYSEYADRLTGADGTSAFTTALHELIDEVKEETGSKKVVIAGCSNGGYMTMVMAMNYGDEYTAYVPICEAVPDEAITDEQIEKLAKHPIYFIWAENDTTVDPKTREEPTVQRLKDAGAKEVVVSTTKDVPDTTGRFEDENGDPHQYSGHWSWVIFDNGESVSTDGVKAWDWIADQIKK